MTAVRILAFAIATIAPLVFAQSPEITADTPTDTATLHKWLHSGDPRLIAWAADFARRNHDAQITAEIPPLLEQWPALPIGGGYQAHSDQHRALLALLDTLIQEDIEVSIPVIRSVEQQFPVQALLLIKRQPRKAAESTLMFWAFGPNNHIEDIRGRAAAMLLADEPEAGVVARVVENAEQHVTVHVVHNTGGGIGGGLIDCGDGGPGRPNPQWPVVFAYRLHEEQSSGPASNEIPIGQIGLHSIAADRLDIDGASGGCSRDMQESVFRHELIAYWLGIKPDAMPWKSKESLSIEWTSKAAYHRELGQIIEQQRQKMLSTFQRLHDLDLLESIPEPRLVVSIECNMDPCPLHEVQ